MKYLNPILRKEAMLDTTTLLISIVSMETGFLCW